MSHLAALMGVLVLAMSPAWAQTPPAPPPFAAGRGGSSSGGGIMDYWWVILLVVSLPRPFGIFPADRILVLLIIRPGQAKTGMRPSVDRQGG